MDYMGTVYYNTVNSKIDGWWDCYIYELFTWYISNNISVCNDSIEFYQVENIRFKYIGYDVWEQGTLIENC